MVEMGWLVITLKHSMDYNRETWVHAKFDHEMKRNIKIEEHEMNLVQFSSLWITTKIISMVKMRWLVRSLEDIDNDLTKKLKYFNETKMKLLYSNETKIL